jgi:hypothetical protein
MSKEFVHIGDRGFWIHDGLLEIWLRFLALHLEDPIEPVSLGAKMRNQCLFASRGYGMGWVPFDLEEVVSSEEGKSLIRSAINSLLEAFKGAPQLISSGMLNLMGFKDSLFGGDIETRRFIEVGHAFLDLLDGKITSGPDDLTFEPGSR